MHATASVTHTTFKMKTSYGKPLTHECPHTRSSSHLPLTHTRIALVCDTRVPTVVNQIRESGNRESWREKKMKKKKREEDEEARV